jgi:L-rhamnose mutarotase
MSERVCFTLSVRPDRLVEYRARHREVWPDMLDALRRSGWRDYSLFLREDGLLIGYLETEDFAAALRAMEGEDVNARWQADMQQFFELPSGRAPTPDSRGCKKSFISTDARRCVLGHSRGRAGRGDVPTRPAPCAGGDQSCGISSTPTGRGGSSTARSGHPSGSP